MFELETQFLPSLLYYFFFLKMLTINQRKELYQFKL